MVTRVQLLDIAEKIAAEYGSLARFSRDYQDHRQHYGIVNSIEFALEQQGLYDKFDEKVRQTVDSSRWALTGHPKTAIVQTLRRARCS